jgi:hypothetical protein
MAPCLTLIPSAPTASTRAPAARSRPSAPPHGRPTMPARPPHFLGLWLPLCTRCAGLGSRVLPSFYARCRCLYPPIGASAGSNHYARTPTPPFGSLETLVHPLRLIWFPRSSPASTHAPAPRTRPSAPSHAPTSMPTRPP